MAYIINNNSFENDEPDIPKWKRELINEKKTFGRTISTSSGLAKLTVTCPRKMRPAIKKQMSLPNQNGIKNHSIQSRYENNFTNTSADLKPTQNGDCSLNEKMLLNNCEEKKISIEDLNFPKPGIVQSLKTKFMSLIENGDKHDKLARYSKSLEILFKDEDNSLQEEEQKQLPVSNNKNNNLQLENTEYLPPTDTVKQTKKLFETETNSIRVPELNQSKKQIRSLSITNNMTISRLEFQKESSSSSIKRMQTKLNENPFINSNCKPQIKPKPHFLTSNRKVSTAHKSSQTFPMTNNQCSSN